jgi:RNA recognition motif-containing protein
MKLYVGNLAWAVDDAKLKEVFSAFGTVSEAVVIKDKYSGRSKGFGFVTIDEDDGGKKAIAEMDGKEVEGRAIKVSEAQPREEN